MRRTSLLLAGVIAATVVADIRVNHGPPLWMFTAASLALLYTIRMRRASWFFGFMAVFFFLGCWVKIIVHHIFDYPYVEPNGLFGGSESEWREYYLTSTAFLTGLIVARLAWTLTSGESTGNKFAWKAGARAVSLKEWLLLIGCCSLFYLLNSVFAFFVTGVDPKVRLPFGLNAPVAFAAFLAIPVLTSIYLGRDIAVRGRLHLRSVLAILTITGIASVSMASRATIVIEAVPMLLAAAFRVAHVSRRNVDWRPFGAVGLFMISAIFMVSLKRIELYIGENAGSSEVLLNYLLESAYLVVDRWIGAEAIMVAVSDPSRSIGLFLQLLVEDPSKGVSSIYQVLSGEKYEYLKGLTFLTLPGYFGVLGLSGSKFLIFSLTGCVTLLGMAYERFAKWAVYGQAPAVALISAALANSVTQMGFPLLLPPFIFQTTILLLLLHHIFRRSFVPLAARNATGQRINAAD